ncbi:FtsW/RodA/SpoVE family cell cycle protein [Massilia sp. LXY-6]|uniref:FtsW/RodA/SpoVE family cell cycle protein n=1 Tax=Massilia sp. LXY-6 TaxID=3379823 RepID=UPI003EE1E3C1
MSGAAVYRTAAARCDAGAEACAARRGARRPVAALLLLLCCLQLACLLRAPAAWMPARIAVALDAGKDMVLDGAALGLPPADGARIRLRRDAAGSWWAADAGAQPSLAVQRGELRRRAGSVLLVQGQRFRLGATSFDIDAVDAGSVAFKRGGARWRYDGATLLRGGLPQPDCPDARLAARLVSAWNRLLPSVLGLARPLVFGGNLDCGNRIAIAGVAAPAASIRQTPDGMLLAGGAGSDQAPLLLLPAGDPRDAVLLAEREARLDGANALQLGRTRLLLERNGDLLHLQPVSHVGLYREAQLRLPEGVSWSWTRRDHWHLPEQATLPLAAALALTAAAGAALLLSGAACRLGRARSLGALGALLLASTGVALLYLQKSGAPAGIGVNLLAAWGALWCIWLAAGRSLPACAAVLLLAIGLLAQLDMGLGGPESSWLRYAGKTAALLAIGAGSCGLLRALRPSHGSRPLAQAQVELALLLLSAVALLLLLLQVAFGDETGVFDLQPVEFAKLALSALTAHCLALASSGQPAPGGALLRALRLGAPALLFLVLLAVALVQVDDYSPLILLAVWGGAMALAFALAGARHGLALACVGAALAGVAGVVFLRAAGPGEFARWNFYADRFMVWLDPGSHPHTGQQLLLGAQAIAGGGWFGADHLFGLASLGQDGGPLLRIPAVQDDFAPSFFLNRHGLAAALLLWCLQALFLAGLLHTAVRCWLDVARARDFRLAWRARFRCFLLCGGAAFTAGHFLLSWGTNLAIFPVMGQPMSFLSAGGSHLLFFICPLLAVCVASDSAD